MGWSGQEDGMDVMKEIIQKEIQSISSLEERVIFKNLMEGVFLSLYDTNREMYEGLERRIKEELDYDKNRYYVKTGIVEREFFDASQSCTVNGRFVIQTVRQYIAGKIIHLHITEIVSVRELLSLF